MSAIANNEKMTTISKNAQVVTLINSFTVEPENQQRLLKLWVEITEDVMCKMPGFIESKFSYESRRQTWVELRPVEAGQTHLKLTKLNGQKTWFVH